MTVVGANTTVSNTALTTLIGSLSVGDFVTAGNTTLGTQALKITAIGTSVAVGNKWSASNFS
jgi:hypothetical protein